MIKGNVVRGKICHAATLKTNKQGEVFTNLSVKVCLPNGAENFRECLVSIRQRGGTPPELAQYEIGIPVEVSGILTFRKNKEDLFLNLTTDCIMLSDETKPDSITGEIEFYGTIGSVPEIKNDKNGNKYLYFSGYSSEQLGEERTFTWVRFIRFSGEQEDFLVKGSGIHLTGALDILFYHDRMNLGCRFKQVAQWGKSKVESE
ncbi:hypothetical protein [Bacteroides sp.]|jgi:hypothetical protein|uniref:hypothetical protein n=1 Tax=Bacteroides sp. TaxID=29523 RepID=UPI00260DDD64|nr:hypothetical protein [Bacteroides sp.]MDD3038062.1 hypothetical protein [Bacteroides sp.]